MKPSPLESATGPHSSPVTAEDRKLIGTPEDAEAKLIDLSRRWRKMRQPMMGTAKEIRSAESLEREIRFQLANAALGWLWHQENPDVSDVPSRPEIAPAIDHAEAWDLAHHRQENSNLARCYIDLRVAVKGLLEGDSMARLEKIDASIADSTVKIGDSQ